MDDKTDSMAAVPNEDLKEWETPTLVVEDVRDSTHGGTSPFPSPSVADDSWYS